MILAHMCSASGVLVLLAATVIAGPVPALFVEVFVHGLGIGVSNSHEMAYRQSITPDGFQARTNPTMRSRNRADVVIVSPLAGILAAATSSELALIIAAGIFVLAAAGLWFSPFRTVRIAT